MIGKKINQLATELAPVSTDLTIIGDPISGVSKKITLAQLGAIFSGAVSFYDDLASFPATGDINVIYCAKDTQKLYLWSGSAYVEVFPSQALLDTYQLRSEKGVSNGYASLDSGGKVPISQLPSSIMEYKGMWDAATNTPTLANGTGDTGDVYICNVAGTVDFGAGPITFAVGDYVIYSGSIWQRSSGAVGTVTSVGLSITGDSIGVSNSPITTSGTLALAFAGTSSQYINGAGNLTTFPTLTGYVPYTGATANVDLGTFDLTADILTAATGSYTSSGGGNTLEISHTSGSGIALNITKGGNGEGLYINKTSGTGNAATIVGTLEATTLVKTGGTSSQFLKADGSVDSSTYLTTSAAATTYLPMVLSSTANSIEINGQFFDVASAANSYTSGRLIIAPTYGAIGYQNAGVFDGLKILTNGNAEFSNSGITRFFNQVRFDSTLTNGTYTYTLPGATGTLALTSDLTGGTVTSVGLSSATSGVTIGSSPITTSGTITLAIATASGSQQGLLSSTDWTTFNNKQNALTNPVTGTGTTNYLPKFTGTSTIGNSNLVNDASGNLLVGTASSTGASGILLATQNASGQSYYRVNNAGLSTVGLTSAYAGLVVGDGAARGFEVIHRGQYSTLTRYGVTVADYSMIESYGTNSNGIIIGTVSAKPIIFGTNSLGRMTLDASGNLGLGNTPDNGYTGYKLQIGSSSDSQTFLSIGNSTTGLGPLNGLVIGNDSTGADIYQRENAPLRFHTNNTERMRLNASGNLSVGNTNDTYKLDVLGPDGSVGTIRWANAGGRKSGFLYSDSAGVAIYDTNLNDAGIYLAANTKMDFRVNGSIRLEIASTGAATFSSSLSVNSSASNIVALDVSGNTGNGVRQRFLNQSSSGLYNFQIGTHISAANAFEIGASSATDGTSFNNVFKILNTGAATFSSNSNSTINNTFQNTNTTDSNSRNYFNVVAGNVTTSIKSIHNDHSYIDVTNNLYFQSGGGVKMTMLSSGNVGIGTTSPGARLDVAYGTGAVISGYHNTSNDNPVITLRHDRAAISGETGKMILFNAGATQVGSITSTPSATAYNTSSDYRLKTDFKDFSGLDLVSKIKAYDYEWKSDKSRSYGVIAHELQSVINYAVTGVKDGKEMQGVDYSKIVPVLIKAIQEQQQQIEQLKNK